MSALSQLYLQLFIFLFLLEFPKFSTFIKRNRKRKREIWLPNTMALLIGIPSSGTTWLQRYSCDIQIPLPLMCLVKTLFIVSLSVETFYTREDFWPKPIGCQNGAKDFFQTWKSLFLWWKKVTLIEGRKLCRFFLVSNHFSFTSFFSLSQYNIYKKCWFVKIYGCYRKSQVCPWS